MKNELNVFTYGYRSWRYLRNIPHNIWQFFRNIGLAYQRSTKGYCDYDVWSLDEYYSRLFRDSIKELAHIAHGYPGDKKFNDTVAQAEGYNDGYEKWIEYLRELSNHFDNLANSDDTKTGKIKEEAYEKMVSYLKPFDWSDEGLLQYEYTNKEAYLAAREVWYKALEEDNKFQEEEKNKALDMLKEVWFNLWD